MVLIPASLVQDRKGLFERNNLAEREDSRPRLSVPSCAGSHPIQNLEPDHLPAGHGIEDIGATPQGKCLLYGDVNVSSFVPIGDFRAVFAVASVHQKSAFYAEFCKSRTNSLKVQRFATQRDLHEPEPETARLIQNADLNRATLQRRTSNAWRRGGVGTGLRDHTPS